MHKEHLSGCTSAILSRVLLALFTLALGITLVAPQSVSAQTYQVIHNFTGGGDGGSPPYTLAADSSGHFFGTVSMGGPTGYGDVFKLIPSTGGWVVTPLYGFSGQDGQAGWGVTLDHSGAIYTSASYNSVMGGPCGSALLLRPSPTPKGSIFGGWNETLMRTYVKREEGCPTGNLLVDQAGNIFGVTQIGGVNGWGTIFELSPSGSGWTETILYNFQGANDGGSPYSGLIMDGAGNLYGTTYDKGAHNWGTVFELSHSGSSWTMNVLYTFLGGNDGGQPVAGLIFDGAGNLYGASSSRGSGGGGTVFKMTPSGGSWTFDVLTSFTGADGPVASLTMDASGKLYGTTFMDDSFGYGSVFMLTPSGSGWTYTDLHDFTGGSDGGYPGGGVILDASGNLYGTAVLGGTSGFGVIYEITP